MDQSLLIADASTLLNFLHVRRFDLMQGMGLKVRIVDAVYDEVASEREQLDRLVNEEAIRVLTLEGEALTGNVARLLSLGLGQGEAFSFAAAIEFKGAIAIDDRRAIKRAQIVAPDIAIITTTDIVLAGIQSNRITVVEADLLKTEWADNHRFRLKFGSFNDLLK